MEPALTVAEFEAALQRLGLDGSPADAGRVLGCTPRAIRHWRQGDRRIRGPVVVLIQVLLSMA